MEGPVFITNTHSVGAVHEAAIAWMVTRGKPNQAWSLPVVAETWDGSLNDINGFHVKREHVFAAIERGRRRAGARGERRRRHRDGLLPVQVRHRHGVPRSPPRGTPWACSSRRTWGSVRICGSPGCRSARTSRCRRAAGKTTTRRPARSSSSSPPTRRSCRTSSNGSRDAPRSAWQGTGATAGNGSGDIFLAFSTANQRASLSPDVAHVEMLSNNRISALFAATVQATEEAIINALVAAETMTGIDDRAIEAIPHERLRAC
jgi:D-aminopeptidase